MIKKTLFAIIAVAALAACNQQDVLENLTEVQMPITPVVETTTSVTPDLAKIVALSTRGATASRNVKAEDCVSNITAVRSSHSGDPLFYAVNFSDSKGFVLVSGSQNYTPILAEVESGTFDEATIPDNMRYYLEEYKFAIEASNEAPDDSVKVYRQQWERYLRKNEPIINKFSRTISIEEQAFIYDSQRQWSNLGYKWTSLAQDALGLEFFEDAMWEVLDSHPDIDLGKCFIVWKDVTEYSSIENLTKTQWGYSTPFNANFAAYSSGAIPVAMAQVMKYNRKPATFNWDNMADYYSIYDTGINTDIANLYSNITSKAKTVFSDKKDGYTTMENAVKALTEYGYNETKLIAHNQQTVFTDLKNGCPVIGCGTDKNYNIDHAWVYSGVRQSRSSYSYYIFILQDNPWSDGYWKFKWDETECRHDYDTGYTHFYINWGQYGSHDGWFSDSNINYTHEYSSGNITYKYSSNRRDIVNIK